MKTLKEYAEFLYSNGYSETVAPYTLLNGALEIVDFVREGFRVNLYVCRRD